MAKQETNETIGAGAMSSVPVLSIEEVRQLKIGRIRHVREGEEPSVSYNFMPRFDGVPEEFFALEEIPWVKCDDADIPRSTRNYAQALREKGESVEVSVAPRGIMCFRMNFRGERIALWLNAWTSSAIVIGSDGKARKPLFAPEPAK